MVTWDLQAYRLSLTKCDEVYEELRTGVLFCCDWWNAHLHRSEAGSVVDKGQVSSAPEECRSFMSGRPSQTPEQ